MKNFGADFEQGNRAREMRHLVTIMRYEGLEPVPWFFELAEVYVRGQMTHDEFSRAVQARQKRCTWDGEARPGKSARPQ